MVYAKGKEKVVDGNGSSMKRKHDDGGSGQGKKRNREVLQFFDDAAYEVDESDSEDELGFDFDFLEDEFEINSTVNNEPVEPPKVPLIPKEEEMSDQELEKMLEERYKPGSGFVTHAEDGYDSKRSVERCTFFPSAKDLSIWKVKCMVGRERYSAFCLMQKYIDLQFLGSKLQIVSAFALDHVKGFIFVEADKQGDIYEACKGLCSIYSSRMAPVPKNEVSNLFSVRSKGNGVSVGMWARVKNGKYKGDLAQVVAVNDARKKVTVKLIPRIDLQAMAEKFGGGVPRQKATTPAPRLISSSELEEFRPLIQYRRDRDTNKMVEILDGKMLKDGYLYKKVSIDSLSFWGVMPTEDELLKFEPSKNEESNDIEWLSQLFGERTKKHYPRSEKSSGKAVGSSSSSIESNFEVGDLVFFGRKDFGVIVGTEKEGSYKVMRVGLEGPLVVPVQMRDLKSALFDKKLFTVKDQHMKTVAIGDTIRVLDGPSKDRQGTVKQIYKGTIFLIDETQQDHNGYTCAKAEICEKIVLSSGKGCDPGPSEFADFSSSPKSPLPSPKKSWRGMDNEGNFNREDRNAMFSVGQSLRIRVGPLKGYLCRVLAVRNTDVTVKLDSQQKILTVKSEHLSEVRGKSASVPLGDDSGSTKPFDLLGIQDGSGSGGDWTDGTTNIAIEERERWNVGASSTERSSWPAFPSSTFSLQLDVSSVKPPNAATDDANDDAGASAWESKATPSQNLSWAASGDAKKDNSDAAEHAGWAKPEDNWKKPASVTSSRSLASDSWGNALKSREGLPKHDNWDGAAKNWRNDADGRSVAQPDKQSGAWEDITKKSDKSDENDWKKAVVISGSQGGSWADKKDGEGSSDWVKDAGASGFEIKAAPSQNLSWAASGDVKKDASDTVQHAGWVKPEDNLKKPASVTSSRSFASDSWGNAIKSSERLPNHDKWDGAAKTWGNDGDGRSVVQPGKQSGAWEDTTKKSDKPDKSGWKKAVVVSGSQSGSWADQKGREGNRNDTSDGRSSGWGQSNWVKSEANNNSGRNDGSAWSNRSTWKSEGAFGASKQQPDASSNGRRGGGSWSGSGRF